MGRMMNAAAMNQYKQQSTVWAGSGDDIEKEKWQMGRWHDGGRRTMDDGWWMTTMTTTQQSNSAGETEEADDGSNKRRGKWQLIQREGKEEGLLLPY